MARQLMALQLTVRKRWLYWPAFVGGYLAIVAGADPERVAGWVVRHALRVEIETV